MSLSPHAAYLLLEIDFLKLPLGGSSTFNTPALVSGFCLTLSLHQTLKFKRVLTTFLVKIEPAWEQATLHSWGSTPPRVWLGVIYYQVFRQCHCDLPFCCCLGCMLFSCVTDTFPAVSTCMWILWDMNRGLFCALIPWLIVDVKCLLIGAENVRTVTILLVA